MTRLHLGSVAYTVGNCFITIWRTIISMHLKRKALKVPKQITTIYNQCNWVTRNRLNVVYNSYPCIYECLYNILNYKHILIGSYLWSSGGQRHTWSNSNFFVSILYKTNRRRQNVVRTTVAPACSCTKISFLPHFDVIFELLLNRSTPRGMESILNYNTVNKIRCNPWDRVTRLSVHGSTRLIILVRYKSMVGYHLPAPGWLAFLTFPYEKRLLKSKMSSIKIKHTPSWASRIQRPNHADCTPLECSDSTSHY